MMWGLIVNLFKQFGITISIPISWTGYKKEDDKDD